MFVPEDSTVTVHHVDPTATASGTYQPQALTPYGQGYYTGSQQLQSSWLPPLWNAAASPWVGYPAGPPATPFPTYWQTPATQPGVLQYPLYVAAPAATPAQASSKPRDPKLHSSLRAGMQWDLRRPLDHSAMGGWSWAPSDRAASKRYKRIELHPDFEEVQGSTFAKHLLQPVLHRYGPPTCVETQGCVLTVERVLDILRLWLEKRLLQHELDYVHSQNLGPTLQTAHTDRCRILSGQSWWAPSDLGCYRRLDLFLGHILFKGFTVDEALTTDDRLVLKFTLGKPAE